MMKSHPESQSHLVELLMPLASFASVSADESPFQTFLGYLARETRAEALKFSAVQVPPHVFGALREATKRWAQARYRAHQLDALSAPGISAPVMSKRVPSFHALVEVPHGAR